MGTEVSCRKGWHQGNTQPFTPGSLVPSVFHGERRIVVSRCSLLLRQENVQTAFHLAIFSKEKNAVGGHGNRKQR